GGPVSVSHTGEATTAGRRACGIVGQSIGGGGGDGGYSVAGGLSFDSLATTLSIGGAGGEGGNGGTVEFAGDGTVQTQGEAAYGLLAQSIGGGGGAGGDAVALTINLPDFRNLLAELVMPNMNMSLSVGGQGGHGGTGGAVNITSDGPLGTQGVYAHGIVAQSIGGGGGAGADAYALDFDVIPDPLDLTGLTEQIGLGADVAIGGSDGAAGHGGAVEVTRGGELTTEADFAQGILAQSVGGGGGTSGVTIDDPYDLINPTGSSSVLRCRAGGSGSGGAVTVTHSGQITTRGRFAHGIVAQSVGGGGGFGAIGEAALTSALDEGADIAGLKLHDYPGLGVAFVGSCGGHGSAEAVTVTHSGRIETFGDLSHGILAQSASGRGNTGAVTVTVDGDVLAHGADAHGILAQSLSDASAAPFTITIHAGSVVRGGTAGGAGVVVEGTGPLSLTNDGEIGSPGGIALLGGDGDDVIDNYGTISGEIDLGRGTSVEMTNHEGARFNTGRAVRLGTIPETSASLINAGTLSPGGPEHSFDGQVVFDGNLVLAATSVLEIDVDAMMTTMYGGDYLMVDGDVTGGDGAPPGGTVRFSFLPTYDVDAEVGPGQTGETFFLGWWNMPESPALAYDFQGCPDYFDYEVLFTDWGTGGDAMLRYTNRRTFGDADDDGDVDLDDFVALKRGFGTGTAWAEGDFDGDHDVDLDDFMILKAHFGAAAVPEPAALVVLALGALVGLRRRR
ncbi:MAG: PEP-CTERM sorting domain-containing protein, partial [Planctomycetota bacterium]